MWRGERSNFTWLFSPSHNKLMAPHITSFTWQSSPSHNKFHMTALPLTHNTFISHDCPPLTRNKFHMTTRPLTQQISHDRPPLIHNKFHLAALPPHITNFTRPPSHLTTNFNLDQRPPSSSHFNQDRPPLYITNCLYDFWTRPIQIGGATPMFASGAKPLLSCYYQYSNTLDRNSGTTAFSIYLRC